MQSEYLLDGRVIKIVSDKTFTIKGKIKKKYIKQLKKDFVFDPKTGIIDLTKRIK